MRYELDLWEHPEHHPDVTANEFYGRVAKKGWGYCARSGCLGNGDVRMDVGNLRYFRSIDQAAEGTVTFCYHKEGEEDKTLKKLQETKASMIMTDNRMHSYIVHLHPAVKEELLSKKFLLFVHDVKLGFVTFLHSMVHPVEPTFVILKQCCPAGPESSFIGPNVQVESGAVIGRGVILEGNIYIHSGVKIGDNVIVKAGTVIGGQGFGFVRDARGRPIHFPHIGGVVIEDDVMIGSNVCIDRGTLGDTVLEKGCRVDNLIHIAHNVRVGRNVIIAAGMITCGKVRLEDGSYVGVNASAVPGIVIGKNSVVGAGACVTKDVEPETTVAGVPAKPLGKKK